MATETRRTLKDLIPAFEVEWAMPGALFLVIAGASIAETWIVGVAVWEIYRLRVGWVIGGVIALLQMLGSMILARNAQHNAARYVRRGWKKDPKNPSGDKIFTEDVRNSEPRLNAWLPAMISTLAGTISGGLALALYGQDGSLSLLDVALSLAAPLGSSGAAMLNSVFVHGERVLSDWSESQRKPSGAQRSLNERSAKRPASRAKSNGRSTVAQRSLSETASKLSAAQRFTCQYCGADSSKRGEPFRTQNALNAHLGRCANKREVS